MSSDAHTILHAVNRRPRRNGAEFTVEELDAILSSIGEKTYPKFINSGYHAAVFWLSDRKKILKITWDYSDANACEIIRKKPDLKTFVKVYQVLEVPPRRLYAIVAEKLTPLSDRVWKEYFSAFVNLFNYNSLEDLMYVEAFRAHGLTPGYVDSIQMAYEKYKKEMQENVLVNDEWLLPEPSPTSYKKLRQIGQALEQRQIVFIDFDQSNFMMRGNTPVLVDLGFGQSPPQNIPKVLTMNRATS